MNNNDKTNHAKDKKIKYIVISLILMLIFITSILIYIFINNINVQGQLKDFQQAAKDKDYKKVSKYLSSGTHDLSRVEAKAFVTYINKPKNLKRFNREINNIDKNLKNKKEYDIDLGSIKDNNGKNIINLKKDGKKFFFIEKLKFTPNYTDVYVKENDNTGVYNYKTNKEHQVISDKNKLTRVGSFFTGNYNVNTKKKIKDTLLVGENHGKLEFDTEVTDKKNKVVATQKFNQSSFKINLKNDEDLDKTSEKVVIDGNKEEYAANKVYGYYFNNQKIKVRIIGTIEGKQFETNDRKVGINKYQSPQDLDFSFNKKEIDKFKKENEEIENKAKKFMIKYTKSLNKAYKKSDYEYISDYIKDDTGVSKHMKKMVESKAKNKYSNPKIESMNKHKDKLQVVLNKDINNNKIRSRYLLKYDKETKEFKIIEYNDV